MLLKRFIEIVLKTRYAEGKTLRYFFRFFLLFQVPHSLNVCSHSRARVREQKFRIKTDHIEHVEQCGTCKLRTCMKVSKSFAVSVVNQNLEKRKKTSPGFSRSAILKMYLLHI